MSRKLLEKGGRLMKRKLGALVAMAFVCIAISPFQDIAHAAITLPNGAWAACTSPSDPFCIESVIVRPEGGTEVALSYGASGVATGSPDVISGKALPGHWSSSNWNADSLGASGYDGLYIDVHPANSFVPWVFVDVQPTLGSSLAVQASNKNYPANLNKNIAIGVKLHLGSIIPGVTFGVGQASTTTYASANGVSTLLIDGYPTTVPLASSNKDCVGSGGKATALVSQFQAVVVPQNDSLGFGLPGASGTLYVGSNGTCKLSTPIWNADSKQLIYSSSAPALSPDGSSE
jgi:hypothetical protein